MLQESGEMYLETIYILGKKNNLVRSIDIANYMSYSKPSVSRAMSRLKESHFIVIDSDGYIALTEKGRSTAEKIYERHDVVSKMLEYLGVNPEVAAQDACKIEHVISDETFAAMKKHTKTLAPDKFPAD